MEKIPCNPEKREDCRVFQTQGKCYEDVHHVYYPRNRYQTKLEKQFRELDVNKLRICRAMHNHIHASEGRPQKPSVAEMREAIENASDE